MKILAIDIGGTHSRFASYLCHNDPLPQLEKTYSILTASAAISSFNDLTNCFIEDSGFPAISCFDATVIAIAGPVFGNTCKPPNIAWEIDLNESDCFNDAILINDFVAQAYGISAATLNSALVTIKTANYSNANRIGIIGAGTGLGHCCLMKQFNRSIAIPSEAGAVPFTFLGKEEKEIEDYILTRNELEFCNQDLIVSGQGLSLLHEFLSGENLTAAEILSLQDNMETVTYFSRFYARACQHYCLNTLIDNRLIISGGIAAKNPALITSANFIDAFVHSDTHHHYLNDIEIMLNTNEAIGLLGAARYAYIVNTD